MQLDLEEKTLLINRKETESGQFGLANEALMVGMFRDKIYKHKLRVIPQEYMANARDAHREIGKDDVPIVVTLPTATDPVLKIRDFGIGIDDKRIKIYSQYGESTKRKSDSQNGGFGVGCKCAWSYTESFSIETIFVKDGQKIKRLYSLYITNKLDPGNYRIISDQVVEDDVPTGTVISVPIMSSDIEDVVKSVLTTGFFWKTQIETTRRNMVDCNYVDHGNYLAYKHHNLYLIGSGLFLTIDGVCYDIDGAMLLSGKSQYETIDGEIKEVRYAVPEENKEILSSNIILQFNIKDIDVSPDRENLDYTPKTISAIRDKINEIANSIKGKMDKFVENKPTFRQAAAYFISLKIPITYEYMGYDLNKMIEIFSKYTYIRTRDSSKSSCEKFSFEYPDNAVIVAYKNPHQVTERRNFSEKFFNYYNTDCFVLISKSHKQEENLILTFRTGHPILTHHKLLSIREPRVKTPKKEKELSLSRIKIADITADTYFVRKDYTDLKVTILNKTLIMSSSSIKNIIEKSGGGRIKLHALTKGDEKILSRKKINVNIVDDLLHKAFIKLSHVKEFKYNKSLPNDEKLKFIESYKDEILGHYSNDRFMSIAINLYIKHCKYVDKILKNGSMDSDINKIIRNYLSMFGISKFYNFNKLDKTIKNIKFLKLYSINSNETTQFIKNIIRSYHD